MCVRIWDIRPFSFPFSIFLFQFQCDCSYQIYCTEFLYRGVVNDLKFRWEDKMCLGVQTETIIKYMITFGVAIILIFGNITIHIHKPKHIRTQNYWKTDPHLLVHFSVNYIAPSKLQFNLDMLRGMERISRKELSHIIA